MNIQDIQKMIQTKSPSAKVGTLFYWPLAPMADNNEMAEKYNRVMFVQGSPCHPETMLVVAPKGEMWAGWVVGIIESNSNYVRKFKIMNDFY